MVLFFDKMYVFILSMFNFFFLLMNEKYVLKVKVNDFINIIKLKR